LVTGVNASKRFQRTPQIGSFAYTGHYRFKRDNYNYKYNQELNYEIHMVHLDSNRLDASEQCQRIIVLYCIQVFI